MLPLFVAATPSYFTEFALYCTAMHGVLVALERKVQLRLQLP